MPLQATSGAASYDGFGGGVVAEPNYIESCFSTYLYTGNGSTQTITNGIDLSTNGGLVWLKQRNAAGQNTLFDTARGAYQRLRSDTTEAQVNISPNGLTSFTSSGFSLSGTSSDYNGSSDTYASWTFREQPKFFDIVTYSGNAAARTIAHSLGSVPACIMVKRTDTTGAWQIYHRSLANTEYLVLNTTAAKATGTTRWNSTTPTSTVFSIGTDATVNASGGTYVAYLFAHDAGGFGLTGTDNVISCGSYTGNGAAGGQLINLGYEAQWVMIKNASSAADWWMLDTMRGWVVNGDFGSDQALFANSSAAEQGQVAGQPDALGFRPIQDNVNQSGQTYIYIAIRRGPMKVPTSGTSVFSPQTFTDGTTTFTPNFPLDLNWHLFSRSAGGGIYWGNRLTGDTAYMNSSSTSAEGSYQSWKYGLTTGTFQQTISTGSGDGIEWMFKRAPSFFDEVCYTGTGSNMTISHNLGVIPELMIVKMRSTATFTGYWYVYASSIGNTKYGLLSLTNSFSTSTGAWNNTTPTSSSFYVGTDFAVSESGKNFVAYLFATCAGVSKVGSYTGNGSTQTINCGFTGGARFVLIKRTDSTGDWYVWDSARGIVSGNDPYLLLNSTAAEVTNTDYIDTYSAGFEISSTAPAAINASGGTFIFLAIA